jgi:hypothetical protein
VIFALSEEGGYLFVMLTEQDVNDMRGDRTKFVDDRQLEGRSFKAVVVSLHKNHAEIEAVLQQGQALYKLRQAPQAEPNAGQQRCLGCQGLINAELMLDGKCVSCWREAARWRSGEGWGR